MAVTATEQWIKGKLDIKTDILSKESHLNNMLYNLVVNVIIITTYPHSYSYTDSIQSLSLAGTYHQKITHLGRSLLSFSSLSNLDLSRNNLESLEVFITGVDPSIMSF